MEGHGASRWSDRHYAALDVHRRSQMTQRSGDLSHCSGEHRHRTCKIDLRVAPVSTKSGRRDLNPRPLEPHSSALPSCATARSLRELFTNAGKIATDEHELFFHALIGNVTTFK